MRVGVRVGMKANDKVKVMVFQINFLFGHNIVKTDVT